MTTLGTRLMTWFRGEQVGRDNQGNRYFRRRPRSGYHRDRRWVIYNGEVEASRVPPHWHAWLHHTTNELPEGDGRVHHWQAEHIANQTGTAEAYRPPGSVLAGGARHVGTGDYQAWSPDDGNAPATSAGPDR